MTYFCLFPLLHEVSRLTTVLPFFSTLLHIRDEKKWNWKGCFEQDTLPGKYL